MGELFFFLCFGVRKCLQSRFQFIVLWSASLCFGARSCRLQLSLMFLYFYFFNLLCAARTVYGDHDRYRNVYLRPYNGKWGYCHVAFVLMLCDLARMTAKKCQMRSDTCVHFIISLCLSFYIHRLLFHWRRCQARWGWLLLDYRPCGRCHQPLWTPHRYAFYHCILCCMCCCICFLSFLWPSYCLFLCYMCSRISDRFS